jgi:DNA-binding protein HU-beta
MTKTEFISTLISKNPRFSKNDVSALLDSISEVVQTSLKKEGEAIIPGIVKFKTVKKPATKERQGINPFTKEPMTIAAKPASTKVKASPQKTLKDAVAS